VGTKDFKTGVVWVEALADGKGNHSGIITSEQIFLAFLERPVVAFG